MAHRLDDAEKIIRDQMSVLPGWHWTRDGLAEEMVKSERMMNCVIFVAALRSLMNKKVICWGSTIRVHGDSFKTYQLVDS